MRKSLCKFLSIAVLALWMVGCGSSHVKGNGDMVTRTRDLSQFDRVIVNGNYFVMITAGKAQSVQVNADSNLLPYILSTVKNGVLSIMTKKGYVLKSQQPLTIKISTSNLQSIDVSSDARVNVANLNEKAFSLKASGDSNVTLTGKAMSFVADVSGSGHINANGLMSQDVVTNVSGSGKIQVNASKALTARISGSGDVIYSGKPETIKQSASGTGRIQPAN